MPVNTMNIIMLGPQASGKGTQASLLSEALNVPHISTGEILRQNIKERTALGKAAQSYITRGALVPDDVVNGIVQKRLSEPDCGEGYILDGYPRTVSQAKALDTFTDIEKVFEIAITDDEAVKRISGRRTCEKCGEIYSIYGQDMEFNNVCKKCGGNLISREDDREDAVKRRLRLYHEETEPLIEFYENKGVLQKIDGARSVKQIFEDIRKKVK
jgi:adenylate kinase